MWSMSASVFLRLIQGGRIRDALAALFARKGIDDEMRWTDQPFVHSGGRLNGDELIHKGFVNAARNSQSVSGNTKWAWRD